MLETLAYAAAGFVFAFLTVAALGSGADNALSKSFPWQFRLAATFRTPVLMIIVVPLSAALRLRTSLRRWWISMFREIGGKAAKEQHEANVEKIASQLRGWNSDGRQRKLRTARPNWAAMSLKLGSNKDDCHLIATSELKQIIAIDVENLTITAEPGVTMGELTDVLLPLGLALQTHVEMESITLGGIAMGFGIETNSFRYGFFQESVLEYSFLDSMAKQHTVTADSAPEVFYALPWSHGTLGFLTRLVVRLVRTKPFVRMVYEPTKSAAQLTERLTALAALPEGKVTDAAWLPRGCRVAAAWAVWESLQTRCCCHRRRLRASAATTAAAAVAASAAAAVAAAAAIGTRWAPDRDHAGSSHGLCAGARFP